MYHKGGETHWEDVFFGGEDLHIFCSTCSKGSMGEDMVTMKLCLFLHEVNHMIGWIPYDDDFQLITYEMIWASLIYSADGEILGGLNFILPHEGNTIAAQIYLSLHTYHKWRRGQCGVGYGACHDHIFCPPILHGLKVEDDFPELPSWKVIDFAWWIAWGWRIHMEIISPNTFQTPYLGRTSIQQFSTLLSTSLSHDDSLTTNLHAEEKQCGRLFDEIASYLLEEIIIHGCCSRGEEESVYPCTFLRISNIWEGRTVMFQNFH